MVQLDFAGPSPGSWSYFNAVPGDVEEVDRATAYAAALYCYVALRFRAENVAEPPLQVVQETDDGEEPMGDHPLHELFADPSPDYDLGEIVELTQLYEDTDGKALWVLDSTLAGFTGRVTPFAGREFKIESTADRIFGRFLLDTARGRKELMPDQVVLFRQLNPGSRTATISPTDVALSWMNLGMRVKATVRALLTNAMFPSIVIQADPKWNPSKEEFDRFKAMLQEYQGARNAGKPFAITGGGSATRVAFSLKDLLPDELLDRIEACVAAAYGVPPVVLSLLVGLKNSPWSQMSEAKRSAYEETIEPIWRKKEKALTRQLLRPIDSDPTHRIRFDTSMIRALQDDESQKITDASVASWWTLDERRSHTGQEPIGGDRGEFVEAIDGLPDSTAVEPADDAKRAPRDRIRVETKASARDRAWDRFDVLTKAQEESWFEATLSGLRGERKLALELFDEIVGVDESSEPRGSTETKAPPEADPQKVGALIAALAEKLGVEEDWSDRFGPLVRSTARTAGRDVAAELSISFDLLEPGLLDYIRRETGWLVQNVTTTTRDRIAAELRAGMAEGESIEKLRARLEDTWSFGRARAELIARTETTRATNGAQREGLSAYAVEEGVGVEKSWLSSRDSRVRPEHQALDDGAFIGIDDAFENGLTAPGEPNCRCTLLYRLQEA